MKLPADFVSLWCFFFFNDTATTEIYTLSLHDALPISRLPARLRHPAREPPPAVEPRRVAHAVLRRLRRRARRALAPRAGQGRHRRAPVERRLRVGALLPDGVPAREHLPRGARVRAAVHAALGDALAG